MTGIKPIKWILAVFTTLLVMLLIGNVVNELTHHEPLERNAYAVIAADDPEPAAAAPVATAPALEPITALLASADLEAGKKAAKRCGACHTFNDGGAKKAGPNLWDIVGKEKGAVAGFSYSDAMRETGGVWNYDDLNAFLADPKAFIEGTKMNFPGFKKVQDRAAVIAYMRQQAATPLPLPQ